jgi:hypothetical protein
VNAISPALVFALCLVTSPAARTTTATTTCTKLILDTRVPNVKPSVLVCPPPPWS